MRGLAAALAIVTVVFLLPDDSPFAKSKRTPLTERIKGLDVSPQELRIRVRALTRPTLGIIEERADRVIRGTQDPVVRRGAIVWKIETTGTFLAAILRSDPMLALADAWGYAIQVQNLLERPEAKAKFGEFAVTAHDEMVEVEGVFRDFTSSVLKDQAAAASFESAVRTWADRHPIEGALYRRPSPDSTAAVSNMLAKSSGGGALAALGGLEETTADMMTRMDLYTVYLPRIARWEAALAADDLTQGVDARTLAGEFERISKAVDRMASVAESAPGLVQHEREATLASVREERVAFAGELRDERKAILDAVLAERIAILKEFEAITARLSDHAGAALRDELRHHVEGLAGGVTTLRTSVIEDERVILDRVVDRAFLRMLQLVLICAALAAVGAVAYARFLRR